MVRGKRTVGLKRARHNDEGSEVMQHASRRIRGAITLVLALAATVPAWAETDRETLSVVTNAEPVSLDLTSTRDPPATLTTMINVTEALWDKTLDGQPAPGLASWESSADGMEITFHLRRNVKFQSGDAFTAKDVVFSFERAASKAIMAGRHFRFIDHVRAVDDETVEVSFKAPDVAFLPWNGVFIASKAYYDRVGEEAFVRHPVGTGPYAVTDYASGQYLQLKAFDGYWGQKPQVRSARFTFVKDDNTRVAKLRAGEADIIMNTPYSAAAELKALGYRLRNLASYPTVSLQFQLANTGTPWSDARVRLAIAEAIDADAMVKSLFFGQPNRYPGLTPGEIGYDPTLKPYPYDAAGAKKLLAEAGYPGGFRMPLYYPTGAFYGAQETADTVVLYLNAVGIDVQAQALDITQFMGNLMKVRHDATARYVAVAAMPMASMADPTEALTGAYYSKSPFTLSDAPPLDLLIDAALNDLDKAQRAKDIGAAIRLIHDQVYTIPLWDTVAVYAMKSSVDYEPTERSFPVLRLRNVSLH